MATTGKGKGTVYDRVTLAASMMPGLTQGRNAWDGHIENIDPTKYAKAALALADALISEAANQPGGGQ